jgi:N-acetylglutamate synthase-like GNAT family acetyltransferase
MEIAYLNDHPEFAALLAQLHAVEWQHLYSDWNATTAATEFAAQHSDGRIPTTLVALRDGQLLGSVSVIEDDLPGWQHLNPWLASLYVIPEFRGNGVGAALVAGAERLISASGIKQIFLFTESRTTFFTQLGWQVYAETTAHGHPAVVMTMSPKEQRDGIQ